MDNAQDKWDVELPWGMPKDSNLLPQHAQDLLRAARSGRIYKRSLPVEEEADEAEGLMGEKPEKKEDTTKDKGFAARAWKQVPRHLEGPDVEYLAKRRKGLQTPAQVSASAGAQDAAPMTRTTVKRTDAAGNVYQEVIVVPQGQYVDGEIVTQVPVVDSNAAPANTALPQPAKIINKKPAVPKGKRKGPGRGRKKKILPPTSAPDPAQAPSNEAVKGEHTRGAASSLQGFKIGLKTESSTNGDTEMGDYSQHASDDDGDDGDDGDEGEIIESDEDQDGSVDGETCTSTPAAENNSHGTRSGKAASGLQPTTVSQRGGSTSRLLALSEDIDARGSPDVQLTKNTALPKEGSPLKAAVAIKDEKSPDVEEKPVKSEAPQSEIPKESEPQSAAPAIIATEQPQSVPAPAATEPKQTKCTSPTGTEEVTPAEPAVKPESATTAAAPDPKTEEETSGIQSEPEDSGDKMDVDNDDDDDDEMLLDTIEPVANPPLSTAEGGDGGPKVEKGEGEGAERQAEREDSEFPDLMGSLERYLDGNCGGDG